MEIEKYLREFARKWGLGDGCASIYSSLVVNGKPMSIREIVEKTGYAYSSVANYLNTLLKEHLVEKIRHQGKNIYRANFNFVEIIKNERRELLNNIIIPIKREINSTKIKDDYLNKLKHMADEAEKYLRKLVEEDESK